MPFPLRVSVRGRAARFNSVSNGLKGPFLHRHGLLTLAIETSCDDTAVAILETHDGSPSPTSSSSHSAATLLFNEKMTSDNVKFGGIHPLYSLASHESNLAKLVARALHNLPRTSEHCQRNNVLAVIPDDGEAELRIKPDFISVTRGPGMRASLSTGLDTAKGLAAAWQVPLVGVHHMQAHALTPRLISALRQAHILHRGSQGGNSSSAILPSPSFPFLTLLVSGGHTLLLKSHSLVDHKILANTTDIAIGNCMDKIARAVLPSSILSSAQNTMFGALLERFAFPRGAADYADYQAPPNIAQVMKRRPTEYLWSLPPPLSESKGGRRRNDMEFSFSGLTTTCERVIEHPWDEPRSIINTAQSRKGVSDEERRILAREAQRIAFEHLGGRTIMSLQDSASGADINAVVVSGGVASNQFLRHVLRNMMDASGFRDVGLLFPPPALCTDNAAMIAWAGMEMYRAGYRSGLGIRSVAKWSLDPDAADGGVLGKGGEEGQRNYYRVVDGGFETWW